MKIKNLTIALLACAGLCACSSEDIDLAGGTTQKVFEGDQAYMTVKISDVGSSTRATSPGTGSLDETATGFEYGSTAEDNVTNAYFYFYDENGMYVSYGQIWNGGDYEGTNSNPGNDDNIEYTGKNVVVLRGLTSKNYPKYVVTVLNRPDGFVPAETLEEMQEELADENGVGIQDTNNDFTMSTSSYYDTTEGTERVYNFVNVLDQKMFYDEPVTDVNAVENVVDIKVERLAAKVTLKIDGTLETKTIGEGADARTLYAVNPETVSGDPNADKETSEPMYIEVLGWKLNCTAKHSNIVKKIDTTWGDDEFGFKWNDEYDSRSFWGESYNYGKDSEYPTSSGGATDGSTLNEYLNYVNLESTTDSPLLGLGESDYCAENTNTVDIIGGSKYSSAITDVILKAVVCDANGDPLDLVRHEGELFTKDSYLKYALSYLKDEGKLNYYIKTTEKDDEDNDVEVYTQVGTDYFTLTEDPDGDGESELVDGKVDVIVNTSAVTATALYVKSVTTDQDGEETVSYAEITKPDDYTGTAKTNVAYALEQLQASLDEYNNDHAQYTDEYKGGLMYYTIPIEHLNPNTTGIQEAQYGVVRNHHYVLTITQLQGLGKGIYNPDEVIVPNPDDQEYYYVAAKVDILSWKLVEQDVKL